MTNSTQIVLNKKTNMEATATQKADGRFEVTEAGVTKEVAGSTFKRWYKVIGEAVAAPVEPKELTSLLEGAEVIEEQEQEQEEVKTVVDQAGATVLAVEQFDNKGKTTKLVFNIAYGAHNFVITEYDGYVCGVDVLSASTSDLLYKSKKMSIKDALENIGYTGDDLKQAKKEITSKRKAAKASL